MPAIGKIIIDFDHTLFDAAAFKKGLAKALAPFGISTDVFQETYNQFRGANQDDCYDPARHLNALNEKLEFDKSGAMEKINEFAERSAKYLYPDALEFVSELSRLNAPLVLLSRGNYYFQMEKIRGSEIGKYFNEIKLTSGKKTAVLPELLRECRNEIFFINDHLEETREVVAAFPNITPLLRRRLDIRPEEYARAKMLNFGTLKEIKKYLIARYEK